MTKGEIWKVAEVGRLRWKRDDGEMLQVSDEVESSRVCRKGRVKR